jgi:uncharacterized membrane protein
MSTRAVRTAGLALVAVVWASAALFGVYILAAYAGAIAEDDLASWNDVLPGVYEPRTPLATVAIGLHLAAGAVVLLLGFVQLLPTLRARHPRVHRVLGRVYLSACLIAGVGGLGFIALLGTVGGPVMDVGFGAYGALMVLCAVQTYRHARARRVERHRAWALRLFALAVGSWLYRMDYGFWFSLADGAGHRADFHGPFDAVMAFAFYVPNLLVVEAYLRGRGLPASGTARWGAAAVLVVASAFLVLGTYFFTTQLWGPAIARRFG